MSTTGLGGKSPPLRRSCRLQDQKESGVDEDDMQADTKAKVSHEPLESNTTADSEEKVKSKVSL